MSALRALWVRDLGAQRYMAIGEGDAGEWAGTLTGTWPGIVAILAPLSAVPLPPCVCSVCRQLQTVPGVVELPGGLLSITVTRPPSPEE